MIVDDLEEDDDDLEGLVPPDELIVPPGHFWAVVYGMKVGVLGISEGTVYAEDGLRFDLRNVDQFNFSNLPVEFQQRVFDLWVKARRSPRPAENVNWREEGF
jgi:hypothetical protein